MTQKEFRIISKHISPKVAMAMKALEKEIDEHYIREKKLKPYQYKALKKIVMGVMIKESIPKLLKRVSEEYFPYTNKEMIVVQKNQLGKSK